MKRDDYIDPRVIRTKRMIREALVEIMEEKGSQKITITDITERAGLARPTFYLHYNNVEGVLREIVNELITPVYQDYFDVWGEIKDENIQIEALTKVLRKYQEKGRFFEALIQNGFTKIITDNIQAETTASLQNRMKSYQKELDPKLCEILVQFISGAFSLMLIRWISGGMKESPELIAAINVRLGKYITNKVFEENILSDILI